MLTLHTLKHPTGAKRKRKVVGRGNAAGAGTYAGRGMKGQKARTGGRKGLKRKGLRMMLLRIPKSRGFYKPKPNIATVNLGALESLVQDNARLDQAALLALGLVSKRTAGVKILGDGSWSKKGVQFQGFAFSASAKEKVRATGGTIL